MNEVAVAVLSVVSGLVLLVVGGEFLVRGASRLAVAVRISPLVVGLTVVAFGTSAPELAVSVQAALAHQADLAVGNVVGSNIFNILFILGISAMIVPLVVSSELIRRDVPIMILASVCLLFLGRDGQISRAEGCLLFAGIVVYTVWCVVQSRKESNRVKTEFSQQWPPQQAGARLVVMQLLLIAAGLVLLGVGSRFLVAGAVAIAEGLGVSELIIGLTIVAAGTSLPEVITSVIAAIRGERDIAVGNVIGSNLFNILSVLGLSSMVSPNGMAIDPVALHFDIPIMVAVAIACLPIFFTGHLIARWEGGLFFFYYLLYTVDLVLNATGSSFGRTFRDMVILFVLPLTVVTLVVAIWRHPRGTPNQ